MSWKSDTGEDPYSLANTDDIASGSGFHTWSASLTTVKVSDPVVLFGGVSFSTSLSEQKQQRRIDLGDSMGFQLGMALALNLDTSLSFDFQLRYTENTKVGGQEVTGSALTTSVFQVGLSRILNNRLGMDLGIGIGLTRDSPDLQVPLSFPISFSWKDLWREGD